MLGNAGKTSMSPSDDSSSTSVSLLDRARKSDPNAWDRLVRLYGPIVFRWCCVSGVQDHDAADVCQEVFRAVARRISDFRSENPEDSFRGWLWTITRNKLRDHFRRLASRPAAVGGNEAHQRLLQIPEILPDDEGDILGDYDTAGGLAHRVLELVRGEFEERTWQAFLRVAVDGQRPASVAEDLGMTVGAVCTAKWRVLRRLREEMDGLL